MGRGADASRRNALLGLTTVPLLGAIASPASAEPQQLTEYRDLPDEFTLMVPSGRFQTVCQVVSKWQELAM